MAQQDKITTIDLIRAVLARNRAALAVVISLAAVVLGASLVLLEGRAPAMRTPWQGAISSRRS